VLTVAGEGEDEDAAALLQGAHRAGEWGLGWLSLSGGVLPEPRAVEFGHGAGGGRAAARLAQHREETRKRKRFGWLTNGPHYREKWSFSSVCLTALKVKLDGMA
jgi:hypothetical protein